MAERRRGTEAARPEQREQDVHVGCRWPGYRGRTPVARRQTDLLLPRQLAGLAFRKPEEGDDSQPADNELRTRFRAVAQEGGKHMGEDVPRLARGA